MKYIKLYENFDNKKIYKIDMAEKRLPELVLNLSKVIGPIKINDQYSINVHKIEASEQTTWNKTIYITCTVSRPRHSFGFEGKGKEPIENVKFEVIVKK